MIVTQQITNHPLFPDVERYVDVYSQQADSLSQLFIFNFKIRCIKDGEDISNMFIQKTTSIQTSNSQKLLRRDANFAPIPNPDFDPEEPLFDEAMEPREATEYDMYLWEWGWDYIVELMNTQINIADLIRAYVVLNDNENYFN